MAGSELRWRWAGRATATLAVAGIAVIAWSRRDPSAPLDAGHAAPDYAAVTLSGDTLRMNELRGNVVLLNVWATWCKPCLKEMPALQRLHDALKDEGFTVLAVSVDNVALAMGDPGAAVREFVEQFEITFPVALDVENRIESAYPYHGLPMTYVIDRAGMIQARILGSRDWDAAEIQKPILKLLEAES